ncbi:hypothetical protein [Cellulomonas soli]
MARILFLMTGADRWTLNDGTTHPTGYWAEEAVVPYEAFTAAGHQVVVATPGGVVPPVDEGSLAPPRPAARRPRPTCARPSPPRQRCRHR